MVIVKASGVTLNKAKLSGTVILGGKAGEVKATGCEITGKVVKIHNSTLTTGSTGGSSGGSSGGARLRLRHRAHIRSPRVRRPPRAWAYSITT